MSSDLKSLVGQTFELTIEKLAVGGSGIARHRFSGNSFERDVVVFVPQSAPGDLAQIKISTVEKTFLTGEIVKIIEPSPHRREPPCSVADICGGCSWQHVNDDEQVRQKELILTDLMQKFLKDTPYVLQQSVIGQKRLNYRNRIQLKRLGSQFGYFKKGSHDIVDIDNCPIADEKINEHIPRLKKELKPSTDIKKFELKINQDGQFEHYPIGETGEGLSFAQVNTEINQKLVDQVVQHIAQYKPNSITELFAGAGNFTFKLSAALPETKINAVELNSILTKYAVDQVKSLKLQKKLTFFTTDCVQFCKSMSLSKDLVLIDPPRSGCDRLILQKIAQNPPQSFVYVSCHPVNLVRDIAYLKSLNNSLKIKWLQIYDMFPQTDHFETFCIIEF